ncbi:ATPase, putative [Hepatocystis sp. ex Piliocolobus tephrosceles]|nr:ATPase, putative [Hepatocystis sp. ex Piliocolobus tephrosceles]
MKVTLSQHTHLPRTFFKKRNIVKKNQSIKNLFKRLFFSSFIFYSTMQKVIGTHSGRFHTDEILASVMLKFLPEYKDAKIIRTRDQAELDKCDIVVDVGGVYDHSKKRYDHHQKEFNDTLDENHKIRLSSAGLIYKHYGKDVFRLGFNILDENKINILFQKIYTAFIESIDAVDNGVNQYEGESKYEVNTTIQSRVNRFNPNFLEDNIDENERFMLASKIVKEEFVSFVEYYSNVWFYAKDITQNAVNKRFDFHKSGRVIFLEKSCPYHDHLYNIEEELNIKGQILYCIFKDRYNACRCTAISKEKEAFTLRLPFPAAFRGLRNEELENASNIKGLTFVHYSGFTSAGNNIECLIKLVEASLKENNITY